MMNFSVFKVDKKTKLISILCGIWLVGGCELLKTPSPATETISEPVLGLCDTQHHIDMFADFCYPEHWVKYVLSVKDMQWPERRQLIGELGDEPIALMKKILLSQGVATPYQHRLRAQNWIVKVRADAPEFLSQLLSELIYQNSQQLLEFESAIIILSRVNSRQEKTINELQKLLSKREDEMKKQANQVEQLLKIETDLIEQNRNEQR